MSADQPRILADLGERRIVTEILAPRYGSPKRGRFGDDVGQLVAQPAPGECVVATVDPCPHPAAAELGFDGLEHLGWLAVTINLSDLAAGGARPLGLVASLVLPRDLRITDLVDLLDGLDSCASDAGTAVVGGNLKDGELGVTVTAIGATEDPPLSRVGARPGDAVCVAGPFGRFWSQVLGFRAGRPEPPDAVLRPRAQVAAGTFLRRSNLVTACIDNSDGLGPSTALLAGASGVGLRLEPDHVRWDPVVAAAAALAGIDPLRLAIGWGDWNLLFTVPPKHVGHLTDGLRATGTATHLVGQVVSGSTVTLALQGRVGRMGPFESERLRSDSFPGIDRYLDTLLHCPLWV
jgi:thiamine-monophosphate kinase